MLRKWIVKSTHHRRGRCKFHIVAKGNAAPVCHFRMQQHVSRPSLECWVDNGPCALSTLRCYVHPSAGHWVLGQILIGPGENNVGHFLQKEEFMIPANHENLTPPRWTQTYSPVTGWRSAYVVLQNKTLPFGACRAFPTP